MVLESSKARMKPSSVARVCVKLQHSRGRRIVTSTHVYSFILLPYRRLDAGNVTARMFFRFLRGYWQTLLQLQETFENGTLFNSTIEVLSCSANDDGK